MDKRKIVSFFCQFVNTLKILILFLRKKIYMYAENFIKCKLFALRNFAAFLSHVPHTNIPVYM